MKRTFLTTITALASFGIASPAAEEIMTPTEANTALQELIAGYQYGNDYTLSFTLVNHTIGSYSSDVVSILTLGSSYYLTAKPNTGIGLSSTSDALKDGSGNTIYSWDPWPTSSVWDGVNRFQSDGLLYGLISKDSAGGTYNYLSPTGMQVSVSYDSAQNASVLDILFTTGSTSAREIVTLNGVYLDASAFAFGAKDVTALSGLSFTYLPEPTTATLALLALAGLASRRRR